MLGRSILCLIATVIINMVSSSVEYRVGCLVGRFFVAKVIINMVSSVIKVWLLSRSIFYLVGGLAVWLT